MGQEQAAMNEHLVLNSMRKTDAHNTGAEQAYTAAEQRQYEADRAAERRKCGLDTGARGWRYVYQTH